MAKICDNNSAGVIIRNNQGELLLIERKSWPYGMAMPAGHLDGDTSEIGAVREIAEEVGLNILSQELVLEKEFDNPCKRTGGDHHRFYVYKAEEWIGKPFIREEEKDKVRKIIWVSIGKLELLSARTEEFADRYGLDPEKDTAPLTRALCDDKKWQNNPGLEPVWRLILKSLKVI